MTFWTVVALLLAYNVYKDNKDTIREHLEKKKEAHKEPEPKKIKTGPITPKRVKTQPGDEVLYDTNRDLRGIVINVEKRGVTILANEEGKIFVKWLIKGQYVETGRRVNLNWLFDEEDDDDI